MHEHNFNHGASISDQQSGHTSKVILSTQTIPDTDNDDPTAI